MPNYLDYKIPASGQPVSTDQLNLEGILVHLQRVKIGLGGSGAYQGDLAMGAATIANSIAVNIASNQTVPVSSTQLGTLAQTTPTMGSGTPATPVSALNYGYSVENNDWRRLPISNSTPSATGVNDAVLTRAVGPNYMNLGSKATYMASNNGINTISTTADSVTSLAYLWHPSSNTKRVSLQKMLISWSAGVGSGNLGDFRIALARITAENGTPGGTSQTICKEDQADATSTCTFRTGANAPTRATGDYISLNFSVSSDGAVELTDILEGKGFIARASQSEGWEVRIITGNVDLTTSPRFSTTFVWNEN